MGFYRKEDLYISNQDTFFEYRIVSNENKSNENDIGSSTS